MTGVVVWVAVRGRGWLRGYEPTEVDFDAPRAAPADADRPAPAGAAPTVAPAEP